jgi:hypothetical protein
MGHIEGASHAPQVLFPKFLDDYIAKENPLPLGVGAAVKPASSMSTANPSASTALSSASSKLSRSSWVTSNRSLKRSGKLHRSRLVTKIVFTTAAEAYL